ncbi:MAG: 2-isopropylmalate synthase [Candidatus Diapherotrites archaeon]|uniref:2-isopropylmalate synthase n=1 Tax=Candidatus Iainarchaeum sp. TaxID=3101447 RepID=A0A938YNM2_9ARCH|nr:2-isopropylmalate synthase [Candidatus Diapherotrites archaeon]
MKNSIEILDTTLRDGEQMQGIAFSAEEKLSIAKILLQEVKVDRLEAASARVSSGEMGSVKGITRWAAENSLLEKVEVLGYVDRHKSVDWILEAGAKGLNLLAKGSLLHLEKQLQKKPEEHFKDIRETIEYAGIKGVKVNVFLEDWSNGIKDSRDYVMQLVSALEKMPVQRIILTDTLGILTPDETSMFVKEMANAFPKTHFDFHGHNDYGLAVANNLAAVKAGCKGVHVTVNGLGERAGNAPLDETVAVLNDKTGCMCIVNEKKFAKLSKIVETFSGKRVAANKPIAGSNVFTQTAGIHADGDKKAGLYENKLKPERFGKERQYALGKLSGRASLDQNLELLGLHLSEEAKERVLKRVVELGDMKKVVTTEDLPYIVSDVLETEEERKVRIKSCSVSSGSGIKPNASFTLQLNGNEYSESAVGDGGYDAFMNALRKLEEKTGLKLPKLIDYEVRIPPGGKTDALVETTITWIAADGKSFATVGVDSDQVMAAVKATEKMLNAIARKKGK